ncbi:MAG: glycosyltransferase family 9 protein [Bacteroidetes bacterium]|nr:glycosyltransferase family 9 protein [Bacteroidota bacterium]MDF2451094.1 glycosyltransferase family 9 protein [Bacteroidota bacterium]
MQNNPVIIISRTDSIGDVVLTLPMAGIIKKNIPGSKVIFLGRNYTRDVIHLSEHVDEFLSYDDVLKLNAKEQVDAFKKLNATHIIHVFPVREIAVLSKKAGIKNRIGTTNRLWHWFTCNTRIKLSRKNSDLHEAQLNTKLLVPLGIHEEYSTFELANHYGFTKLPELEKRHKDLIDQNKMHVILHPKSKGSAREWGLDNFSKLINELDKKKHQIFVSGTAQEGELVNALIHKHPEVVDLTGKLSLQQFIAFINHCDALIAASTGPLHIASALEKKAIGLFAPMRPIHPGRWKPIGKHAEFLVLNKNCSDCRKTMDCHCIREIETRAVIKLIEK